MNVGISVSPDAPDGERWNAIIDGEWYRGFATGFDAWAFVFVSTGLDTTKGFPDKNRQSFNRPPEIDTTPKQMKLI